jgi:hypothetical protein
MDHLLSREKNSSFHVEEELVASGMMLEWLSRDSNELMPIRLEIHYHDLQKTA